MIRSDITAHKQKEAATAGAVVEKGGGGEERYRRIAEALTDYIYTVKIRSGQPLETLHNQGCLAVTGYTPEEFAADPSLWWNIVVPEDREAVEAQAKSIIEGSDYPVVIHRIVHKDGKVRWVRNTPVPHLDEKGLLLAYDGLIQDITEHKLAQQALAESEERFRTILENIEDGYFEVDLAGNFIFTNESLARILGYERHELTGMNNREYMDTENSKRVFATFNQVYLTGKATKTFDWKLIKKDGSECFVETSISLKKDRDGNPTGFHGITRDITDRKLSEEALALEKTLVDAIFNSIPGLLYLYDSEYNLVRWNKKHETMTGYSPEELASMKMSDWFGGDQESWDAIVKGVEMTQKTGFGEAEANFRKKDGTTIPMYFTGSLLTINGERYLTGIGIDISERKLAEERQERLQAQLSQAQKMESVGRLAGGVAHDFNNMLGIILGHSELVLEKLKKPGQQIVPHLLEIRKAAERSADLTRQLLAFARKQIVTPLVLNLNETVVGMLKMLKRLIGEDIQLIWIPGKDLWQVKIDPSQVDQIMANCCVNARDAIDGIGKITVETKNITLDSEFCASHAGFVPGDYVSLIISDNGCGMDKETLKNLFEPFFTTKEVGKGTGLGTAMVYGIVKQNQGIINVYSEPGQGTSFSIYLPRHQGTLEEPTQDEVVPPVQRGNETILLVEDEQEILELTTIMLEYHGYTVLAAATPKEAIELAEKSSTTIDLLMTDVIMPEMNGRDLAEKLYSLNPGLKGLFMSGYTADVIANHGVLDKNVNFIQKPFSMQDLAMKVRDALKK
jgi:PAS domain S-box-containing protein